MEKQSSLRIGALEKLQSFRLGVMEKQKSFRMDKQRSFRLGDRQQSFKERKNKESPGKRGDLELHLAARAGNAVHVHKILSECSETQLKYLLFKQNQDGETALYIAAEKGHVEAVREILKVSDIQSAGIKANNNYDSFHIAAKQGHLGHVDVVNLLLETDASLAKIARNNGKTVLHSAARMGHVNVVKSLLDKDPSIGLRTDKKGQTAFHMAVKGQNIVQALLSVGGIDINAVNRAGETALSIAEKCENEEIAAILREFGAVVAKEPANTMTAAKQLKQTVSDIKHDVQSQLRQTCQTEMKVQKIKKRLQKLHLGGLNNAINSNTVVAVLIATVAFAAIFQLPGQFVPDAEDGFTLGQAYIAKNAAFIIFLIFDSLALFISLAVVVVQTSLIVVEQKAKRRMVFVMNKLMWLACLFISVAFISLTYIVVGHHDLWLAWSTMAIGATIMLTTLGSMCYCVIVHRMEEKNMRNIRRNSGSRSRSWSISMGSDSEILNSEYKKMYAL
ncbi:hypothetical protein BHM03_00024461 [Ensete ventricosum]|nr:hypothetical protein BHM03_00024461 [Ensete ventricosum]